MPASSASNSNINSLISEKTDDIIKRLKDNAAKDAAIANNVKQIKFEAIKNKLAAKKTIKVKASTLVETLSEVSPEAKQKHNYVAQGENIQLKNDAFLKSSIDNIATTAKRTVAVSLTDEALQQLRGVYPDLKNIKAKDFELVAYNVTEGQAPALINQLPFLNECTDGTYTKCLQVLGISDPALPVPDNTIIEPSITPPAEPPVITAVSKEDILKKINELLLLLRAPEFNPVIQIDQRANAADIQNQVNGFQMKGGPADQTAFYDFYNLQIAFEHIWQEVFDEGVLDLIHDIYGQIVDSGVPEEQVEIFASADNFINYAKSVLEATETPHSTILKYFDISTGDWNSLYEEHKTELLKIAGNIQFVQENANQNKTQIDSFAKTGQQLIDNSKKLRIPTRKPGNKSILQELQDKLNENYSFTVFAADRKHRSINFGILVNYRQKWEPLGYQAGELVSTCAMAPKESRTYKKRLLTKKSLSQKETASTSVKRTSEFSETVRAEEEIVKKAMSKTNFTYALKTNVSADIQGVATVGGDTAYSFSKDTAAESASTRKDFREAIAKSAEEYKNDHSLEITTSDSSDFEAEETGIISNPNDELTVTYLFFELQRLFRVNEQLYRVMPVVLVAQEVPKPNEITRAWVISHDWIIRRVLLDDTFIPALNYLATKVVGDAASLTELKTHLESQRKIVNEAKTSFIHFQQLIADRYTTLEDAITGRANAAGGSSGGLFGKVTGFLLGGGGDSAEKTRIIEEAAQDAYNRAIQDEKESRSRLEREVSNLQSITETYTKALSDHLNQETQINRLLLHLKLNIFYYMQAIWLHEPADERYFRLHQVQVPDLTGKKQYSITEKTEPGTYPDWHIPRYVFEVSCELDKDFGHKSLVEVADLDNLIGFKGNYMIFPLKESNELTDYMIAPYLNRHSGIGDPDPAADWSLQDYFNYICCLKKKMDRGELSQEQFAKYKPALLDLYKKLITSRLRQNDEIIIPTGSLFIEALPGTHPILEDFKLMHRAVDVKKVQADARYAELENLRSMTRILFDQLEDPSIEKKIIIEGGDNSLVVNPTGE